MQVTFTEYDKLMETFDKIPQNTFWPTPRQVRLFEEEPEKWLLFGIYLYEKGEPPKTNQEKYGKKNLQSFINKHLEISE